MKQIFTLFATVLFAFVICKANATIRRVGYFGAATPIDYSTLQSAHDSSKAGDSIYVYPGVWTANFSKKIILIGYGYFLTGAAGNTGLQNITGALSVTLNLYKGSDTSVFQSLDGLNITIYQGNSVNEVTINRCNLILTLNDKTSSGWLITQSFIQSIGANYVYGSSYGGTFSNLLVNNCIIQALDFHVEKVTGLFNNAFIDFNNYTWYAYNYGLNPGIDLNNGNIQFTSCIFTGQFNNTVGCTFQYCIGNAAGTTADAKANPLGGSTTGYSYYNNFAYGYQYYYASNLPAGTGNQTVDVTTVYAGFVGHSGNFSTDGAYALSTNSPAKGKGAGGVDCGAFGGPAPYQLSGLPPVPTFYQLTAPANSTSGNPYTITISVKSNN